MKKDRDSIDHFLQEWRRERPDLDPRALGILGRVQRLSARLQRIAADEWLAPLGLTWESFSLIMALRRSGRPYRLRPTDIYRESLLTSGAITNRIDRVEAAGLVRRVPDEAYRRSVIIQLTTTGRELADRAIKIHFKRLDEVFACLTDVEERQVAALLSKLLAAVEHRVMQDRVSNKQPSSTDLRTEASQQFARGRRRPDACKEG